MNNKFTDRAQRVIKRAQEEARRLNHDYIGVEHLLFGLLAEPESVAVNVFSDLNVPPENVKKELETRLGTGEYPLGSGDIPFHPLTRKVLSNAILEAQAMKLSFVGTEHILLGILKERDNMATSVLESFGLNYAAVKTDIHSMLEPAGVSGPNNQYAKTRTPLLDDFGKDLTALARQKKLDPVIGRQNEIERVIQILTRRTKNNPVLVGDPGVGKTAIVEGLAQKIVNCDVPEMLFNRRVIILDMASLVAGTKYRGDFEQRLKNIIQEIRKQKHNIILFIDEMHTLIRAGSAEGSPMDASNIMKPSLARGELQCIGATTFDEFRKFVEHDKALERRFQPVTVNPPSQEEAVEILRGLKHKYEDHHKVRITDEAISAAVTLSERFISDRFLPDKAIDLMDEASSRIHLTRNIPPEGVKELERELKDVSIEKQKAAEAQDYSRAGKLKFKEDQISRKISDIKKESASGKNKFRDSVTPEDISYVISQWTGIPVSELTESESDRLLRMEKIMTGRIIGQDEAVASLAGTIRRSRTGLRDPKKPIGSFLFLGGTGVGKTETAKALAEFLFGKEDAIIRVDMSEYLDKASLTKLIGSPPGYVGYEEGGVLTEQVRRKPYSVVLFDEIEKAHPDIYNILLTILDEGSVMDNLGHKVLFNNTVVILTSNIGSFREKVMGFMSDSAEAGYENMKQGMLEEVKKLFRPELVNRLDEIIVFRPLAKESIARILELMIDRVTGRLSSQNYRIVFSDNLKKMLAEKGYDPDNGARPLSRMVQRYVEDYIAGEILKSRIRKEKKYSIDFLDDKMETVETGK